MKTASDGNNQTLNLSYHYFDRYHQRQANKFGWFRCYSESYRRLPCLLLLILGKKEGWGREGHRRRRRRRGQSRRRHSRCSHAERDKCFRKWRRNEGRRANSGGWWAEQIASRGHCLAKWASTEVYVPFHRQPGSQRLLLEAEDGDQLREWVLGSNWDHVRCHPSRVWDQQLRPNDTSDVRAWPYAAHAKRSVCRLHWLKHLRENSDHVRRDSRRFSCRRKAWWARSISPLTSCVVHLHDAHQSSPRIHHATTKCSDFKHHSGRADQLLTFHGDNQSFGSTWVGKFNFQRRSRPNLEERVS